jgi:hypothetical protein
LYILLCFLIVRRLAGERDVERRSNATTRGERCNVV